MIRRIAAVVTATAMLFILAVPVMAGGWAEIVADGQTTTPRRAIRSRSDSASSSMARRRRRGRAERPSHEYGYRRDARCRRQERPSGRSLRCRDNDQGGRLWSWQVTLANLESDHLPVRMTVLTAAGATPPFDPSSILAAVDRAKSDVTTSLGERIGTEVQRLEVQDDYYRTRIDNLAAQTRDLTAQREALEARVQALEGVGGLPLLAVISLSVLAGSAAGFAMAWLAGRASRHEGPAVTLKPAPRGVDRV